MIFKNGFVMTENFEIKKTDLRIHQGIIAEIADAIEPSSGEEVLDLTGNYLLPGFIDTHLHGACGHILSEPGFTEEMLFAISRYEATQGVTSIAISSVSCAPDHLLEQCRLVAKIARLLKPQDGAKIAALHAEGPFLNPKRKGAMNETLIIPPDQDLLDQMYEASEGLLRLITVAPERDGALAFISYAAEKGISVSMGHTDATYEEALAGISAGATRATHTFNAMRPYSHRDPGVLGAVLTHPDVTCEMICDHVHIHPATIELIYRMKGADRISIISDSEFGTGVTETKFVVNGQVRYVRDGVMRLENGTIAGSASSMLVGIRNLLMSGYPLTDVSRMASLNPARAIKRDHQTGSIALGKAADLVILNTQYEVLATYVDGHKVHSVQ